MHDVDVYFAGADGAGVLLEANCAHARKVVA